MIEQTTREQKIEQYVKALDSVQIKAAIAVVDAIKAGCDNRAILEAGLAVLIAAGRKPFSADAVLAKMEAAEHGQTD